MGLSPTPHSDDDTDLARTRQLLNAALAQPGSPRA
jgi:hypothetical protein